MNDANELRDAIRRAVDYRGDVTIRRIDGRVVEGFAFDARLDGSSDECIRVLPADAAEREVVRLSEIESVSLSGKDAASGRVHARVEGTGVDFELASWRKNALLPPLDRLREPRPGFAAHDEHVGVRG